MSENLAKRKRLDINQENIKKYGYRLRRAIRFHESPDNILTIMNQYPMSTHYLDRNNEYPLHLACRYLNDNVYNDVILQLIKLFPIAMEQPNKDHHDLPLHIACSHRSGEGVLDNNKNIILKLIESCPMSIRKHNKNMEYPLNIVLRLKKSDHVIYRLFVSSPKTINNEIFKSHLMRDNIILSYYNGKISKAVLQKLFQTPDNDGQYPIHDACSNEGSTTLTVGTIMELDPLALHRKTPDGLTPLHLACIFALTDIVDMFIKNHVDDINVNACDVYNETPLNLIFPIRKPCRRYYFMHLDWHEFVIYKCEDRLRIVQILLDHPRIDIVQKNDFNGTPLDLSKFIIKQLKGHRRQCHRSLQFYMEIRNILEDYQLKRRWKALCYHLNDVIDP